MPLALWLAAGGVGLLLLWGLRRPVGARRAAVPGVDPRDIEAGRAPSGPPAQCPPGITQADIPRLQAWARALTTQAQANPRSVDPRVLDCVATALQQHVELAAEADALRMTALRVWALIPSEAVPQGPIAVPTSTGRLVWWWPSTGQLLPEDYPTACAAGESMVTPLNPRVTLDPRAYAIRHPERGLHYCVRDVNLPPAPSPLPLTRRLGARRRRAVV